MPFNFVYKGGFTDFLEEVEQGIREAKESFGIRVFNMSINCLTTVQPHSYSTLAARTASDTICQPTETVRGFSVGALNCPGGPQIADTPARYSRRGPGLQVG